MEINSVICPICTLFLRSGMRLEDHLQTHPKEKVIEALVSLSFQKAPLTPPNMIRRIEPYMPLNQPPWQQTRDLTTQSILVPVQQSNNQSFFYQQFVSSTAAHPGLTMNTVVPQYVTIPPTNFSNQYTQPIVVSNPYVYQQQQQQQMQIVGTPVVSLGRSIENSTNPPQATAILTTNITQTSCSDQLRPNHPIQPAPPVNVQPVRKDPLEVPITTHVVNLIDITKNQTSLRNTKTRKTSPITTLQLPDITITKGKSTAKNNDSRSGTTDNDQSNDKPDLDEKSQVEVIPIYNREKSQAKGLVEIKKDDDQITIVDFKDVLKRDEEAPKLETLDEKIIKSYDENKLQINYEIDLDDEDTKMFPLTADSPYVDNDECEDENPQKIEDYLHNEECVEDNTQKMEDYLDIECEEENIQKIENYLDNEECEDETSHKIQSDISPMSPTHEDDCKKDEKPEETDEMYAELITPDYTFDEPQITECDEDAQNTETKLFYERNDQHIQNYRELTTDSSDSILPDVIDVYPMPKIEKNLSFSSPEKLSQNSLSHSYKSDANSDIKILKNEIVSRPVDQTDQTASTSATENLFDTSVYPKIEQKEEFELEISETVTEPPKSPHSSFENLNAMNVVEFDGIKLVLNGDLINMSSARAERSFNCIEDSEKSPTVLLNIGEMIEKSHQSDSDNLDIRDESASGESLNIRADEKMPPRGELSEQESNGASEAGWGRTYQECSSGVSTSYDLLARESWEASDCSDSEVPPLQSRVPIQTRFTPERTPPRNYKCSLCSETFYCPKERRVHHTSVHGSTQQASVTRTLKRRKTQAQTASSAQQSRTLQIKTEVNEMCDNFTSSFDTAINTINTKTESKSEIRDTSVPTKVETLEEVSCSMCKMDFPSMKLFIKHHKNEHKDLPVPRYKCGVCSKAFAYESKYTEHLKVHPLECTMCCKYFYRRQNMQLHLKRHLGIKPYKCEFCSKAFITKQKMTEHLSIHLGTMPLKCKLCDETFRRHSNLIQHRNLHHFNLKRKRKDFVCHCGEIFHSKKKFLWHNEIHDTKPKSCTYCSDKFVHTASLTRHMRSAHNKLYVPDESRKNENVQCGVCKKVYLKNSLDVHMKLHAGIKPYPCNICNKEFSTKWNLKLHRWTHAARTSKPFKCSQCKSAFIRQSDYVSHMNSHRNVRPYTCNHCGRQFIRKYNCQRHVREHERDKSYKCNICNKEFHRSYYLKEHQRIHSGDRPFSCHICGKTSATKSNHNKHIRIHHAREPVSTEN